MLNCVSSLCHWEKIGLVWISMLSLAVVTLEIKWNARVLAKNNIFIACCCDAFWSVDSSWPCMRASDKMLKIIRFVKMTNSDVLTNATKWLHFMNIVCKRGRKKKRPTKENTAKCMKTSEKKRATSLKIYVSWAVWEQLSWDACNRLCLRQRYMWCLIDISIRWACNAHSQPSVQQHWTDYL